MENDSGARLHMVTIQEAGLHRKGHSVAEAQPKFGTRIFADERRSKTNLAANEHEKARIENWTEEIDGAPWLDKHLVVKRELRKTIKNTFFNASVAAKHHLIGVGRFEHQKH